MVDLPTLSHLRAITDSTGVLQHAIGPVPNREFGYCTDDVARALAVTVFRLEHVPDDPDAHAILRTCLAFLVYAAMPDGRFHNFMSYERTWLDDVGTEDSFGRAVYGLGIAVAHLKDEGLRAVALRLLKGAVPHIVHLQYLRAHAYAAIGVAYAFSQIPEARHALEASRDFLLRAHTAQSFPDWDWFEDILTYDNARLPEAMLRIGVALGDSEAIALGLRSLGFLRGIVIEDGQFVPIGNAGWYPRGGNRARYCQQPLEATAMVEAQIAAYSTSRDPNDVATARIAHAWYLGKNSAGLVPVRGSGCCDGLASDELNPNMGAESTLAYLMSSYALQNVIVKAH